MPTVTPTRPPSPARRFAAAAAAWGLGIFAVLRLSWVEAHAVLPLTQLQGRLAAGASGVPVLPVDVTLACSGTDVLAVCVAAILAYPARWRARLAGAAGGVLLILLLNTVRIATLARAVESPTLFTTLHLYVWPVALVVAVAAYVFGWMRLVDAPGVPVGGPPAAEAVPAEVRRPAHLRFVMLCGAFILVFAAASPLYLNSAWVLAVASVIAHAGALLLPAAGISASAAGTVLVTARGSFQVTQECIVTPLIPVYAAAAVAYAGTWRRAALALVAALPLFAALGIARLLVVALPAAMVGSPLFLIHAFYQLVTACVAVAVAAWWRHGSGAEAWRRAALAIACGGVILYLLAPVVSRVFVLAPPLSDEQGALTMLPAFQIALAAALWIAAFAPVRRAAFAIGLTALAGATIAGLAVLHLTAYAPHVRDVRAWAIVGPLLVIGGIGASHRPRR